MTYQLYQSCLEDVMACVCNDCLSHDPDKLQIHRVTVCTTGWLNEADAHAPQQLLTPHNETLVNESVNKWLLGSDDSGSIKAASDSRAHICKALSECWTSMQHFERGTKLMAKAEGHIYPEWYLYIPRIY